MPNLRRSSLIRQVGAIRRSLLSIEKALRSLSPLLRAAPAAGREGSTQRARKLTLSPARRAALKLQGQYMGHVRRLKPRQKARVKALRASKGVPAAIRLAKRLAKA
jgi:hypothetical protein